MIRIVVKGLRHLAGGQGFHEAMVRMASEERGDGNLHRGLCELMRIIPPHHRLSWGPWKGCGLYALGGMNHGIYLTTCRVHRHRDSLFCAMLDFIHSCW